jgi:hypothetical protein
LRSGRTFAIVLPSSEVETKAENTSPTKSRRQRAGVRVDPNIGRVAVDSAAINGTGTAPQPLGILHYPVNTAGPYTYASRSANVTFGDPATWPNVLAFEKILEQGLIVNDGSFGSAVDPTVRDKWQQTAKLAG